MQETFNFNEDTIERSHDRTNLRIGTCSWKYDSWRGIVYSGNKSINYLEEYSQHFNTVEIDQWFWSLHKIDDITLPDPEVVKGYSDSVPDDFVFSIKVPNSITLTHLYRKSKNEPLTLNPHFLNKDLFEEFLKSINGFGKKAGPLIFQFEYLNKEKMSSCTEFIERFESFISELDKNYLYALEIRNPNYLTSGFFDFVKRTGLSPVFLQGYFMPSIFKVFETFKRCIDVPAVVRLHGPDRESIEEKTNKKWNQIIEPKDDELQQLREIVNFFRGREIDLYVNVNNHYEGSAPLTIRKIKEILQEE